SHRCLGTFGNRVQGLFADHAHIWLALADAGYVAHRFPCRHERLERAHAFMLRIVGADIEGEQEQHKREPESRPDEETHFHTFPFRRPAPDSGASLLSGQWHGHAKDRLKRSRKFSENFSQPGRDMVICAFKSTLSNSGSDVLTIQTADLLAGPGSAPSQWRQIASSSPQLAS